MQRAVRTCLMRGGTSKGVFLRAEDLPPAGALRDAVVLRLFGSPDPRQIDGLGGADTLTSKMAIVGPPSVATADVDYTFGQVSFVEPRVDYKGNCGNISSAVGPFAVDKGLVPAPQPGEVTRIVRIHNTNTGAVLRATVFLGEGQDQQLGARVNGDVAIAGVPGTGAPVDLDFSTTQGSVTGSLLPSGQLRETLIVATDNGDTESLEVTLLDAGQPTVFVRASQFIPASAGLLEDGKMTSAAVARALERDAHLLRRVERLRGAAAVRMGIVERWQDAEPLSPYTPFVAIVSPPPPGYHCHLSAVCVFMQQVHKAYPVTGSVATVAAALLPGTVPHAAAAGALGLPVPTTMGAQVGPVCEETLDIGHPSGVMTVEGTVRGGEEPALLKAAMRRTARCLMDGHAYVPWSVWPQDA